MSCFRGYNNTCPRVPTLKAQSISRSETAPNRRISGNSEPYLSPSLPHHHHHPRQSCSSEATSNGVLEENWSKAARRHGHGCLRSFAGSLIPILHATSTASIQRSAQLQPSAVRTHQSLKAPSTLVTRLCFLTDPSQSLRRIPFDSTSAVPFPSNTSQ